MYELGFVCIALISFISVLIWAVVGIKWNKLRIFFHENYSFFDVSFIVAYFFEQLLLILLLTFSSFSPSFLIGIFALIVVTTASFQKLTSESRLREISDASIEQNVIIDDVLELNEKLIRDNKELNKTIDGLRNFIERLEKKR
jgi:signal transduction histidine kinase